MSDPEVYYALYDQKPPFSSMAAISLILSISGVCCLVPAPIGAILGHIAKVRIRGGQLRGDGVATAGIVIGWIVTVVYACVCGLFFYLFPGVAQGIVDFVRSWVD